MELTKDQIRLWCVPCQTLVKVDDAYAGHMNHKMKMQDTAGNAVAPPPEVFVPRRCSCGVPYRIKGMDVYCPSCEF
jgi:hypothetical protein